MAMPSDRYSRSKHTGGKPHSGGGYDSLKTKSVRESTREKPMTHKVSEEASAQLGASVGFRGAPTLYQGQGFQPVKHGNELATNVGKGGPGTGRTIYKSGSQMQYGPPAPEVKDWAPDVSATGTRGVDILKGYGPERRR
jgi:hypothetical protein